MCPFTRYPLLQVLLKPFRKSQQKTLALFLAAIAETAEARSFGLAAHVAARLGIQIASALRRFYRLLENPRIEDRLLSRELLRLLGRPRRRLLIAVDWTKWPQQMQMLLASAVVGRRAIAVQSFVGAPAQMARSQNAWERDFVRQLAGTLRELSQAAVLLFDRGFHRARFVEFLDALGCDFVVRLTKNVSVCPEEAAPRVLASVDLSPGGVVDLGWVWLRQDRRVRVRVVGIWAKGQTEPWYLATNLEASLAELAALYDRRMGVEEQIRDTKGMRFGVRLKWTQFETPRYLARFALLLGVALLLWTAAGAAIEQIRPKVRMRCKKKGPRLSLVRVGIYFLEEARRRWRISARFVLEHLPPPRLRTFAWLDTPP